MHHEGSLTVTKANASSLSHITSVGGYLYVRAEVDFPQLTSVGGSLYVEAEVDFPQLTSVGGNVNVGAEVDFPQLTGVGGYLSVGAEVDFPQLTSVGGYLSVGAEADFPQLTSVGGNLYVWAGVAPPDISGVTFGAGQVLALWGYALHFKDGLYRAGCRGPWTAEQALAHWTKKHHEPLRAGLFRQVILENEGM